MEPIRLIIVGGFLGSGKTTLLRKLIQHPTWAAHLSVLVNERGALGLDADLIASEQTTQTLHIQQLTSGCICCTLQGALPQALLELAERTGTNRPHWIIIETSGVSMSSEVAFALESFCSEQPGFRLDMTVSVVDAVNVRRAWNEQPDLLLNQLQSADLILLNKQDLIPSQKARDALVSWLRPWVPRATLVWTTHADVNPSLLLGEKLHNIARSPQKKDRTYPPELISETVLMPQTIPWTTLESTLEEISRSVFRFKGVVDVLLPGEARPTCAVVQGVGDRIDLDPIPPAHPLASSVRRLILIGDPNAVAAGVQRLFERMGLS